MTFADHNRRLYDRLHKRVLFLCWTLVPIIFVLEIAILISRSLSPNESQTSTSYYLRYKLFLPTGINLVALLISTFVLLSDSIKLRAKNWISTFSIFTICCVISVCHREFWIVILLPCAPILFSTIFADKALVRSISALGAVAVEISIVMTQLPKNPTVTVFVTNLAIGFAAILCCVLLARLMIRTSSEQMSFICDAFSTQEELIDELHVEPMTGLSNRTALDECLLLYIQKFHEGEFIPHLVLMDIDHFKHVNDTYGHNAGDIVIKNLASVIKKHMKGVRRAFRFGGDEMVLIFGNESLDEIKVIIENIRQDFKNTKYNFSPDSTITLSIGVSAYYKGLNPKSWFELTDSIMYKSKEGGRDSVNYAE